MANTQWEKKNKLFSCNKGHCKHSHSVQSLYRDGVVESRQDVPTSPLAQWFLRESPRYYNWVSLSPRNVSAHLKVFLWWVEFILQNKSWWKCIVTCLPLFTCLCKNVYIYTVLGTAFFNNVLCFDHYANGYTLYIFIIIAVASGTWSSLLPSMLLLESLGQIFFCLILPDFV